MKSDTKISIIKGWIQDFEIQIHNYLLDIAQKEERIKDIGNRIKHWKIELQKFESEQKNEEKNK